jgi:hypothetical protein
MGIHAHVPDIAELVPAWEWGDGQQLLVPPRATVRVVDEPAVSPYGLDMRVVWDEHRYVITSLDLHADSVADFDRQDEFARFVMPIPPQDPALFRRSEHVPPITPRGLAEVKLPAILSRALRSECKVRRRMANGSYVTGMGREDELPAVYLLAQAVGDNPTQAVAEHFGIGRSAAAQRVSRARQAKPPLLPPVAGGR